MPTSQQSNFAARQFQKARTLPPAYPVALTTFALLNSSTGAVAAYINSAGQLVNASGIALTGIGAASVRLASTANVNITTGLVAGQSIDSVVLVAGDRVLLKNQSTTAQNGVYVATASGAASRASDFDAYDEHPGAMITVQEGTSNADKWFLCTSNKGGTLGSTAIAFTKYGPVVVADIGGFGSGVADALGQDADSTNGFVKTSTAASDATTKADAAQAAAIAAAASDATTKANAAQAAAIAADPTRDTLGLDADDTPQFAGIALGHTNDTDITRIAGGVLGIEGVAMLGGAVASVASSPTTSIGAAQSATVLITGNTGITAFDTAPASTVRYCRIDFGGFTITHNVTSLNLPGSANIATFVGDRFTAVSLGSGNWIVTDYTRADGLPVGSGSGVNEQLSRPLFATTATANGTTQLEYYSASTQQFTGTSLQTAALPQPSVLVNGWAVRVINKSTQGVTLKSYDSTSLVALGTGQSVVAVCRDTGGGNGAAAWQIEGPFPQLYVTAGLSGDQSLGTGGTETTVAFTNSAGTMSGAVSSNIFTAPVAGTVRVQGVVQGVINNATFADDAEGDVYIYKNGSTLMAYLTNTGQITGNEVFATTIAFDKDIVVSAGDTITVKVALLGDDGTSDVLLQEEGTQLTITYR